jgi:hypothetical protein
VSGIVGVVNLDGSPIDRELLERWLGTSNGARALTE